MAKNAGIRVRVDRELLQHFHDACNRAGVSASEVIREFMDQFVEREIERRQSDLFKENSSD